VAVVSWGLVAGCAPPRPPDIGTEQPPVTIAADPPTPSYEGPVWFTDVTTATGIDFVHESGDSTEKPFPSANGSGLGAIDYDLDGRQDLCFVSGTPFPVDAARNRPTARCYRHLGGLRFADTTEPSGLAHHGYAHGVAVGDYDADGFPDLFISGYGGDILFHNRGDGTFERLGPEAGLDDGRWSSSAAFLDADGDGLLDLYVCRYGKWTPETNRFCGDRQRGARVFCSPLTVEPEPDVLRLNSGDGAFRDATAEAGLTGRTGRALAVIAAHLDTDAALDLYVANDMNPNSLWLGDGTGRFRDMSDMSGTAYDHEGKVKSSMGIDVADSGNRGHFDIIVTDFQGEENLFFSGSGDGIFRDTSESSGAGGPSVPFVSWGVQFADFDLDGWDDAMITNGHVGDDRQNSGDSTALQQLPLLLHNQRGHFTPPSRAELGAYFLQRHQGRGVIATDLDNDGDADLALNHRDEPATVLRNDRGRSPETAAGSCVLRLVGTAGNRDAIGAVVTFSIDGQTRIQQVKGGGGYQSARDQRLIFVVPAAGAPAVSIRWPGGRTTAVAGLGTGQWLVIEPATPEGEPGVFHEEPPR
jgi:hypothetical protein